MANTSYRVEGTAQRYERNERTGKEVPVGKRVGTHPITLQRFFRGSRKRKMDSRPVSR